MIALISSVPEEGKVFIKHLKEKSLLGCKPVHKGRIQGKEIAYMISGIGKTNAAHAAAVLLERVSPDLVILFGVGGAYSSTGLKVGDIAVAEKEVYGDEGILAKDGFQGAEFIGIPFLKKGRKRYFNGFPFKRKLVEKAVESSALVTRHSSLVTGVKSGAFVTVSTCSGTRGRALELKNRFNAVCENMEGASVAHICTLYGTPMIEIRGISNIVEDRDRGKWNIKLAADNCQRAVTELLKNL